jgi:hypothetical protein
MTRPDKASGQADDDDRPDQDAPDDTPEGGPPSGDPGPDHDAGEVPEWR